jgi:uncharacterized RDD family membrane protein YckC
MTPNTTSAQSNSKMAEAVAFRGELATFGDRLFAALFDLMCVTIIAALLFYVAANVCESFQQRLDATGEIPGLAFLGQRRRIKDLAFVIYIIYCTLLESSPMQATLGKWLLGIRATDEKGVRLNVGDSLLRNLSKIISAYPLGLGYLWALWSPRGRAWHDMIANTMVIQTAPKR